MTRARYNLYRRAMRLSAAMYREIMNYTSPMDWTRWDKLYEEHKRVHKLLNEVPVE